MPSSGVNLANYLIPLEEINRATENFSRKRRIGDGGFGAVYKGQLSDRWQNRTAAIKRLSQDSRQGEREFRNELETISRFHHENIICFIGYCDEGGEMIIVYEYAINGSLDHYLQNPNKLSCITWTQRLEICLGAAKGLNYLHSGLGEHNRVIHRDIKSANILLDESLVAKISDFGLSRLGPRNQPDTELYTKVAGTQFYLDPAYLENGILKKESDVYSFGVVMFEILSGMLVYCKRSVGDNEPQLLMTSVRRYHLKEPEKLIDPHIRDQIDSRSFEMFKEIAYRCISFNSMERPALDTVIQTIEEALTLQTSECSTSNPAKLSIIESLLCKLNSTRVYDHRTAAGEIRLFAKRNDENRVALAQAGAIPLLTELLSASDVQTQEHAVAALLDLSSFEDNRGIIMSSGAVPVIIHVLKEGSMEARENAAATLSTLSSTRENTVSIGADGGIPPLMVLLSEGTERGKKHAATALYRLCINQGNKERAVRAGVVPILVEFVKEPQGKMKTKALTILSLLSSHPEGMLAICEADVVPILVELIGSGSPGNKENAVAVLLEVCGDDKYLVEALELGVEGKLIAMRRHATSRGRKKAQLLLRKLSVRN